LLGGGFGNLIRTAGHTYGAWASVAVLVVPLLFLGALVYYVLNRDARREYQQTRTITVEKKQKLHWAFKAMLWIYAAIIALMMVVIAATGFH
jgi:ABC-type Fe3+ transport system permease subunit